MELSIVARWETRDKSMTSWTEAEARRANPVFRVPITSEWSPKMERDWAAKARAVTWKTVGSISPATLCMTGIISRRPWDAVKVVVMAPAEREPWTAPAAPPSDCNSTISMGRPKRFFLSWAAQLSASSAIGEEGVIG